MSALETPEEFHARLVAAADEQRRLPVAVEEMPGWFIYPYESDSLRMKPLGFVEATEQPRSGEDPAECRCALDGWAGEAWPGTEGNVVWHDDEFRLLDLGGKLPSFLMLQPRGHHDLIDMPDALAARMGVLLVALAAAVETLPSVGRAHVMKIGDGGAHLHWFAMGRPARMPQFRGSPLLDWEENFPDVPRKVLDANTVAVVAEFVRRIGGTDLSPRRDPE